MSVPVLAGGPECWPRDDRGDAMVPWGARLVGLPCRRGPPAGRPASVYAKRVVPRARRDPRGGRPQAPGADELDRLDRLPPGVARAALVPDEAAGRHPR